MNTQIIPQPMVQQQVVNQVPVVTRPSIPVSTNIVRSPIQHITQAPNLGMMRPPMYTVSTYRPRIGRNYPMYPTKTVMKTNMNRPGIYGSRTYTARRL